MGNPHPRCPFYKSEDASEEVEVVAGLGPAERAVRTPHKSIHISQNRQSNRSTVGLVRIYLVGAIRSGLWSGGQIRRTIARGPRH